MLTNEITIHGVERISAATHKISAVGCVCVKLQGADGIHAEINIFTESKVLASLIAQAINQAQGIFDHLKTRDEVQS